jgi:hypothetical protein
MYIQERQVMSRKPCVPKLRGAATDALGGYKQSLILRECALLTREENRCYQRLWRVAETRDLLLQAPEAKQVATIP